MTRRVVTAEQLDALVADYAPPATPTPPPPPPPPTPPRPEPGRSHGGVNGKGRASPVERCRAWLARHEASIEGQHGSDAMFCAARVIWNDFGLDCAEGYPLLQEYNARSVPPWPEEGKQGLRRKWDEAEKKGPGPEGRGFRLHQDRPGYGPPGTNGRHSRPGDSRHAPESHGAPGGEPGGPSDPAGGQKRDGERPPPEFRFIDSEEFLAGDYRPQWLVPRILVRGQPGVIAGPSKGMKTSFVIDLAVSLATATAFLGRFPVRERVRVAVVSGESGEHTLKETCLRVLQSKGLDGDDLWGWLKWEFTLPTFSDLASMEAFAEALAKIEADVLVLDPTYLCLGEVDAKNLFEMGRALKVIAAILLKKRPGLTVILVHHANRLLPTGEVMELQHLAYSGLEQFARQFILLNRREPYRNDGEHDLWVRVGGSAGHGGLWSLHISEGLVQEDFAGRKWELAVHTPEEVRDAARVAKERQSAAERLERNQKDEDCVLSVIDAEAARGFPGASVSWIGDKLREAGGGISDERIKAAIDRLLDRGVVVKVAPFEKPSARGAKRTVTNGFGRPPKAD